MFPPVEAFIGIRYIHASRGNHFIAFMSLTSIVATALGVAVLLTILSIMNGFEGELRERILGMASHIIVETDDKAVREWRLLVDAVARNPLVVGAAPFVSRDVLLSRHGIVRAVEVRGVVPELERRVASVDAHMSKGRLIQLQPGSFRIVIGRELADAFGVSPGDTLTLIAPQPIVTPAGLLPRLKRFEVIGIFEFGLNEHDSGLGLIHLVDAQRLFRTGSGIDGVRAVVEDASLAPAVRGELTKLLRGLDMGFAGARDWTQMHRNLFRALKTEKIVMFCILAIAIGIAAFNIVSILVMAVIEKRPDIAMLGSLGMERGALMRVFLIQGGITGIVGVAVGLGVGVVLALNVGAIVTFFETVMGFKILSPEVYYISDIPSELRMPDLIVTAMLAGLLSVVAPLYPAWLAVSTVASEGLRHE